VLILPFVCVLCCVVLRCVYILYGTGVVVVSCGVGVGVGVGRGMLLWLFASLFFYCVYRT